MKVCCLSILLAQVRQVCSVRWRLEACWFVARQGHNTTLTSMLPKNTQRWQWTLLCCSASESSTRLPNITSFQWAFELQRRGKRIEHTASTWHDPPHVLLLLPSSPQKHYILNIPSRTNTSCCQLLQAFGSSHCGQQKPSHSTPRPPQANPYPTIPTSRTKTQQQTKAKPPAGGLDLSSLRMACPDVQRS